MKRFFLLFLTIAISSVVLKSQIQTGDFTLQMTDRGITSYIFCSVPADYDSTKPYPFIMAWHGAGDNGNNMRNAIKIWLANSVGAILVCPDANNVNGMDGTYFSNLISVPYGNFRTNYNVDTTKMIVLGFSWGGGFSYQIGLLNPQLFTGIIGLAPAIGSLTQTMWDNIHSIRMATILGTLDFNYSAVNALMNQITNSGGELLYIIKQGVQHVDNTYFNSEEIKTDFKSCYDFVNGTSSGIEEKELDDKSFIGFYPNPFSNNLKIVNNNLFDVTTTVRIINLQGEVMLNYRGLLRKENSYEYNTVNFPQGVYLASIQIGEKFYHRILFKIQ